MNELMVTGTPTVKELLDIVTAEETVTRKTPSLIRITPKALKKLHREWVNMSGTTTDIIKSVKEMTLFGVKIDSIKGIAIVWNENKRQKNRDKMRSIRL